VFERDGFIDEGTDGIDNDGDNEIDELDEQEQIIMSKFVYYNNDFTVIGNPESGTDIYNYLRGIWKDNVRMQYGGNGYGPSGTTANVDCDYMFPDDSDNKSYWGTGGVVVPVWNENTAGNTPYDRRFIQSAGPFTLEPGGVNYVTSGVVWAPANQGEGPWSAVENLKVADDIAQALFDNEFKILNGPDAPTMEIQEMNNALILSLENSE
jgi:hypothetical protein